MNDRPQEDGSGAAEQVYAAPADALEAARGTLANGLAGPEERAEALLVLGRAAYYANNMSDAVQLLDEARQLSVDPDTVIEVLLTLAPALSKQGDPEVALDLLENLTVRLDSNHSGQLRNQIGIIMTELGRLPEALEHLEEAVVLLREAGDDHRETRTLVNLGAVSSMMSRLDDAEHWYELALNKTIDTGQHVVAAGIEGNLGYLDSRRGNFGKALGRYGSARESFAQLGDVDLLVAVLEVDHARTLLDVGLAGDALNAAERAAQSATAGSNQMLDTQAHLLIAEAALRLGDSNRAAKAAQHSAELASQLGQRPLALRANYLLADGVEGDGGLVEDRIQQLLEAAWISEAFTVALGWARRHRDVYPGRTRSVLEHALEYIEPIDPMDRALAELLVAVIDQNTDTGWQSFDGALVALTDQRDLLGSVEMRAVISHRALPLTELGLALAFHADDVADAALAVLEKTRTVRSSGGAPGERTSSPVQLGRLRDARVLFEEAKLNGGDVGSAARAVRRIEKEVLDSRRSLSAEAGQTSLQSRQLDLGLPKDTAYLTYAVHGDELLGLVRTSDSSTLTSLGAISSLAADIRQHRSALRRIADERRDGLELEVERLGQCSDRLDRALVQPLGIEDVERVVLTPPTQLRHVAWSGLPSLKNRPLTLTTTLSVWNSDRLPVAVQNFGFLGGPDLSASHHELEQIAELWQRPDAVQRDATCPDVLDSLGSADLVHVAAHGSFRADNAFFSALQFSDDQLSILEMAQVGSLPDVIILTSCDAAASASVGGDVDVVVGTATELRNLGSRIVIAPSMVVNDRAASQFGVALHRALVAGESVDDAMLSARSQLLESGDARQAGAAVVFNLFGTRATRGSLQNGRAD